jgi:hypothetical protein
VPYKDIYIEPKSSAISALSEMINGNKPVDGGHLILEYDQVQAMLSDDTRSKEFIYRYLGAADAIQGKLRFCLWIPEARKIAATQIAPIAERINAVREFRIKSSKELTREGVNSAHAFQQVRQRGSEVVTLIPMHSSASRAFLPIGLYPEKTIVSNGAFSLYDAPLWNFAILSSRLHLVWIAAVCGKIKTDYRYSCTLGWNTFPVPPLTEKNKADLTRCAEDILLAREAHFPASIADLYEPDAMPEDLRHAHDRNDEVLERIYIGRRFKNDSERLEKLFDLYTKMAAREAATQKEAQESKLKGREKSAKPKATEDAKA